MAASKPTAVHFSLIFFVMLTLIFGVMAYLNQKDLGEANAKLSQAEQTARTSDSTVRKLDEELQALKKLIGNEQEEIGLDNKTPNTVIGATEIDIKNHAGVLAEGTIKNTLLKLSGQLDQTKNQLAQEQADKNKLEAQYLALKGQLDKVVDQHRTAREGAEKDLADTQKVKEEEVSAKDQQIAALQKENEEILIELDQLRETDARKIKDLENKNNTYASLIDTLRSRLTEVQKVSFEKPDGEIRTIDNSTGVVWINLGEADRLPKRMNFSVYRKAHQGIGRGEEDIIGAIEVTKILGPHLSEARIVSDDIYQPISPGDPIYTPLWGVGRPETFAVSGIIDLDGDGKSDMDLLNRIVENANAKIDNIVTENGERIGNGLTVHTKFLVIGESPDVDAAKTDEQRDKMQQVLSKMKEIREEARLKAVRVIGINDFLSYIGYKPQRRLYTPGSGIASPIKAGARQTGVNAVSSGQVSGVYSRGKRLKQQTSSGQTSKVFGGSGK
ncbi:hypothetical protein Pan153_40420 [Gimesia panareensis]|uniref:Uncharacterized protein n=1 Tax=Gimesia panareensis TaxID=2527978 RepID=A0A518FSQ8_9PLAN|nr:hypothetical protein [Gimesia panareensis]QDV19377.1 hypothetical protein Pan153_40420 [Gimesia panareensis]